MRISYWSSDVCSSDLSADYQVCNCYTSTHPQSSFVNELIAARPVPTGRHVLHNRQYSFYRLNGQADRRQLDSLAEIKHLLENEFRIATSEIPRLDVKIGRAHVWTPVTNAQLVCRLLLDTKTKKHNHKQQ